MSRIDIFLLDNLNNTKEEVNMIKPKTYQELLVHLRKRIKNLPQYYEIYIIGKNNEDIKINNEEKYKKAEDILFIREINKNMLEESLFAINYNRLSESQQEKLDEQYNCILCSLIIKNENPYLCYQCQKIFHVKCLDTWEKKCREENKIFSCPNCRNEFPKENWKKKLDHESNRKEKANLINKMNEIKLNDNMKNNINRIKEKKINELKNKEIKQYELIEKYEKYILKTIDIFKNILIKINSLHHFLNSEINKELNQIIIFYPLNLQNLYIDDISNIINEELDIFKNNLKNKNINRDIKEKNKINDEKKIQENLIEKTKIIGNNLYQYINNLNEGQISLLKIAVNIYKENDLPQMNFNNEIQINNLINVLFSPNIIYTDETDFFNYITQDKRRKKIKFIFNSAQRFLIDIPIFFTNKELYSIAGKYKKFNSTKIILIHNYKILKNNESSIDEISNGDIIWVIENILYPDNSYFMSLKNKYERNNIFNVNFEFTDGTTNVYSLNGEVTIQELIRAINEDKGYPLGECQFLYNANRLNPGDIRKINEIFPSRIVSIKCYLIQIIKGRDLFLGKKILAKGNVGTFFIGTLDPIRNLFDDIGNSRGNLGKSGRKILIGNLELKPDSSNYLSFYGINEDFNFIFKEE